MRERERETIEGSFKCNNKAFFQLKLHKFKWKIFFRADKNGKTQCMKLVTIH